MALWSLTKAKIINRIEMLVRRLSGKEVCTSQEGKAISDGFNAAIVDLCMDSGISHWRFIQTDYIATTTASTAYVDLDANIFNVISGTVRIESENISLLPSTLEAIYKADPNQDNENLPAVYALDSSSDPETLRMVFGPIPDAAYTISFVGESIPDEDSISSFPSWCHAMLQDKATENALRNLGYINEAMAYAASYNTRRNNNKASQGHDSPICIRRRQRRQYVPDIQSRIN